MASKAAVRVGQPHMSAVWALEKHHTLFDLNFVRNSMK